jgi:hypothetical protein
MVVYKANKEVMMEPITDAEARECIDWGNFKGVEQDMLELVKDVVKVTQLLALVWYELPPDYRKLFGTEFEKIIHYSITTWDPALVGCDQLPKRARQRISKYWKQHRHEDMW